MSGNLIKQLNFLTVVAARYGNLKFHKDSRNHNTPLTRLTRLSPTISFFCLALDNSIKQKETPGRE